MNNYSDTDKKVDYTNNQAVKTSAKIIKGEDCQLVLESNSEEFFNFKAIESNNGSDAQKAVLGLVNKVIEIEGNGKYCEDLFKVESFGFDNYKKNCHLNVINLSPSENNEANLKPSPNLLAAYNQLKDQTFYKPTAEFMGDLAEKCVESKLIELKITNFHHLEKKEQILSPWDFQIPKDGDSLLHTIEVKALKNGLNEVTVSVPQAEWLAGVMGGSYGVNRFLAICRWSKHPLKADKEEPKNWDMGVEFYKLTYDSE